MGLLEWLRATINDVDDVRVAVYIMIGIPGLALLWWRSASASRQARAALEQVEATQRKESLEQYQSSANMLTSDFAGTRIAAIYTLMAMATDKPDDFHVRVMQLFFAFLSNPPHDTVEGPPNEREDVQTILRVLRARSDAGLRLEKAMTGYGGGLRLRGARLAGSFLSDSRFPHTKFEIVDISKAVADSVDFRGSSWERCSLREGLYAGSNFSGARISSSDLSGSDYFAANFTMASFEHTDLSHSSLKCASLRGATLRAVSFMGSDLEMTDLTGTRIIGRKDQPGDPQACVLTQAQLDVAAAYPSAPPKIGPGSLDAVTGLPLVWNAERGRANWERRAEAV